MTPPEPVGFFSYSRADDEHDQGALTELRRRLASEVGMQIGRDFTIFQDRDTIQWGQSWRKLIEDSLDGTSVLIVVLTPRFFASNHCRDELARFLEREEQLGRDDLVLPIYYIDVIDFAMDSDDSEKSVLAGRNYIDWRELRFEPLESVASRKELARMAQHLVEAIGRPNPIDLEPPPSTTKPDRPTTDEGMIELLALAEDGMALFEQTILDFGGELESLGEIAVELTAEMEAANSSPKPSKAKLTVARKMADECRPAADRLEVLATEYNDQLGQIGRGIQVLVDHVPDVSDDELGTTEELLASLGGLRDSAAEGMGSLSEFRQALQQVSSLSSTVRPVMRRIDHSVASIIPSAEVFDAWHRDLEAAVKSRRETGPPN